MLACVLISRISGYKASEAKQSAAIADYKSRLQDQKDNTSVCACASPSDLVISDAFDAPVASGLTEVLTSAFVTYRLRSRSSRSSCRPRRRSSRKRSRSTR